MPEKIALVAEEKDFLLVDKPAGLGMHDEPGSKGFDSLVHSEFDDNRLAAAHRLDKETSGLLLVAKGKTTLSKLSSIFQNKNVEKYYWAISSRKPKKKQGTVSGGMVKARNGSWKITRDKYNVAVTQFFSYGLGEGQRAFLVRPISGKTHQIRVALKSLGAPIIGDERYGGDVADRMYLHAAQLSFTYEGESYAYRRDPKVGDAFNAESFVAVCDRIGPFNQLRWPDIRRHEVGKFKSDTNRCH